MTLDELVELVAQEAIEKIERESLTCGMSLGDASEVCRHVAKELNNRADMFDDEEKG